MNIKYIKENNGLNSKSAFRLKLNNIILNDKKLDCKRNNVIDFKVGDNVKHELENIFGKITFICDDYISIKWNDNSKEKFTKQEMKKYITLNTEIKEECNLEENKIDIEKLQLKRKVDQLEKNNKETLINKVKAKAANEIVELAISKGIIDEDDKEVELQMLSMLNDTEYEEYCERIIEFTNEHQVTSKMEDDDDNKTEAERMLHRVKNTGAIIGDFNNMNIYDNPTKSSSGCRNLSDLNDEKITFDNQYVIPSFEEQFSNILKNKLGENKMKRVEASNISNTSDDNALSVFKNITGITKPIQIPNSNIGGPIVDYNSFFNSLNWSVNKIK